MDIVININSNYLPYAIVMLESFFCHNSEVGTCVHLLYASMKDKDREVLRQFVEKNGGQLETYQVDGALFEEFPALQRWSVETLFRLLIPEVLPQSMNRVLYLDADIIIEKSLRQLFFIDFQGKSMAVCRNTDGKVDEKEKNRIWQRRSDIPYFNAGVLMMNLERMRKVCTFERYCFEVRKNQALFPLLDQDLLNYVFGEDVCYIPAEEYNCIIGPERGDFPKKASVYHFGTSEKPWLKREQDKYHELWWKYAEKTGYCCR